MALTAGLTLCRPGSSISTIGTIDQLTRCHLHAYITPVCYSVNLRQSNFWAGPCRPGLHLYFPLYFGTIWSACDSESVYSCGSTISTGSFRDPTLDNNFPCVCPRVSHVFTVHSSVRPFIRFSTHRPIDVFLSVCSFVTFSNLAKKKACVAC